MQTAFSTLVLVLLATAGYTQSYEPVKINGKYGFAEDLSGEKLVIPARYDYATHFREERALVQQHGRWGFIDPSGNWVVEPKFDKAQLFTDGRAHVYVNGKAGMIGLDGRYIVEPIYESFEETWFGMVVTEGELKGVVTANWKIPATYIEVYGSENGYVSGQRADNLHDLYYNGNLILEGMDETIGDYGYGWDSSRGVIVQVNGKKGLLSPEGKWLIEPKYVKIDFYAVNETIDEEGILRDDVVYKLDASEYQYFDDAMESSEVVGSYRLFLADENGRLLHSEPFESVKTENSFDRYLFIVTQNGKVGYVGRDLSITMTAYENIDYYYDWKFAADGKRQHILDKDYNEIAVFDEVNIPVAEFDIYDEYGQPIGYYTEEAPEPYATVRNGAQSAVFGLRERMLVSPWASGEKYVSLVHTNNSGPLYVVHDGDLMRYSYYHPAMAAPSGFVFTDLEAHADGYLIASREGDRDLTLLATDQFKGTYELLKAKEIVRSASQYLLTPETDEPGEREPDPAFYSDFMLYKNAQNKYGVVAQNNTVVPARYDSVAQNKSMTHIVDVLAGGKWGSIDIRDGKTVAPQFDEPLVFQYNEGLMTDYALFEEKGYYVSSSGRKFQSLSGEYIRFRENGLFGLKAYNDFSFIEGSEELVVVVPAVYKEITFTDYPNRIIVKGQNNKYGLIDNFNDTLLPFVHTKIVSSWNDMAFMDTPLLATFIGKKQGIYGIYNGKYIPASYDRLIPFESAQAVPLGVAVVNDGKKGLVNLFFELALSCSYDALLTQFNNDFTELYACKDGKWYMLPGVDPYMLTDATLLQQRPYDLIINHYGYVKTAGGYDRYEVATGRPVSRNLPESAIRDEQNPGFMYQLFVKDGRIGAKDDTGKVVLKPSLTCVLSWEDGTLYSVLDGEPAFYYLTTNEQHKQTEW